MRLMVTRIAGSTDVWFLPSTNLLSGQSSDLTSIGLSLLPRNLRRNLSTPLRIAAVACASHTRYRAIPAIVGYMTPGKQQPYRRILTGLLALRLEHEFRHHNLPGIAFCVFTVLRFRCFTAPGHDRVNRGGRASRFRRRFKRLCKTPPPPSPTDPATPTIPYP